MLRWGYWVPFVSAPPLSPVLVPLPSYSPSSIKRKALQGEIEALIDKGVVELAPLSPGYYSCLFVVQKASGFWGPVSSSDLFLNGIESVSPSRCQEVRLDDLSRPQGCIFSGSHSSRQSQVSSVCCGRQGLSVLSSVFRSLHDPSSVHLGHGSSVDHITQPGRQDAALSRRLARSHLFSSGGVAGKGQSSSVVLSTGYCGKSRKVVSGAISDSDVFRNGLGQLLFWAFPT